MVLNLDMPPWLILYGIWNMVAFLLVRMDKRRASRKAWRIRERTFFLMAMFFGAAGILAGMYIYRHKTLHLSFVIGIPVLLLLNLVCGYYLLR